METLTVMEMKKLVIIEVKTLQIYSSLYDDVAFITQALKYNVIGYN